MKFIKTDLQDVYLIEPQVFEDHRGFFFESYHQEKFKDAGINYTFVQDNHSRSQKGTLRGLHLQLPPHGQTKLVRCLMGEIYDVVVDIRPHSPSFGKWASFSLSQENKKLLLVPQGFAHGIYIVSDVAEVHYKCDALYNPNSEISIVWNDPDFNIEWPFENDSPLLSQKDQDGISFSRFLRDYPNLEWT